MEDMNEPTEVLHFEYRYIKSKAGPLYKNKEESEAEIQAVIQTTAFERKNNGGIRMCQRCLRTKPDRTHHCS